ncbi:MAG: RlmE family RNA methyltransferase [Rhodospirillaceae bacterium]|nr:RlmE family RNA methyltransferase [Rhodospirillaceae bacterium]
MPRNSSRRGGRREKKGRVKTARRRPASSTRWLDRQLNDPYVAEARRLGYRSRAAFKLIEIDDRLRLFRPGQTVVDLGAAPGGWTQVALERTRAAETGGRVIALDRLEIDPVPGAEILLGDFQDAATLARLEQTLGGARADLVLSDLSPSTTGHRATDHLRIVALAEDALAFAEGVLKPGGAFVAKVFRGGADADLLKRVRARFETVRHVKPPASRADSAETYLVAQGFRPQAPA